MKIQFLVAVAILALLPGLALGEFGPEPEQEPWPGFESFEGENVPAHWRALQGSRLSLSGDCRVVGKQSLLWQWSQAKARIEIHDPVSFPEAEGGGFVLWLYNQEPSKEKLRVFYGRKGQMERSFTAALALKGDRLRCKSCGRMMEGIFTANLNFKGWRSIYLNWRKNLGVGDGDVDTLVLEAPEGSAQGSLYIDCFLPKYSGLDPVPDEMTPEVVPAHASHWTGFLYFDQLKDPYASVESVPPKALEDMRRLVATHLPVIDDKKNATEPLSDEALARVKQDVAERFALERRGKFVNGKWVLLQYNCMYLPLAEVVWLRDYVGHTAYLVGLYRMSAPSPNRDELLQIIFDMVDHLHNCGYAHGSRGGTLRTDHLGYEARSWPSVLTGLRVELAQTGRYAEQLAAMNWFAGLGRIKARDGCDCDTLNTQGDSLFKAILLEPDDVRRYRLLKNFSDWLSHGVFCRFKPDGSSFHHTMHFPAYTQIAVGRAAAFTRMLSGTEFRLSPGAHERIRSAVYATAFTHLGPHLMANIRGRTSIDHSYKAPDRGVGMLGGIREMAFAGTPDGTKAIDPEMAELFLALAPPETVEAKELAAMGFTPKAFPRHYSLNGASAALHRKGQEWMVSVSGMKAPGKGIEIYRTQSNSYSRYVRCGGISAVTRSRAPQGGYLTGQHHDGWDWFHIPGSTAVVFDPQVLYVKYGSHRNGHRLAGGTHLGDHGVWGMNFTQWGQEWRKSAFFFGDHIVLLGSGIRNRQGGNTVTTLFQDFLPEEDTPTVVSGEEVTAMVHQQGPKLEAQDGLLDGRNTGEDVTDLEVADLQRERKPDVPIWVLNHRNIGFYLPAGQAPFTFVRSRQTWTYHYSWYLKDPNSANLGQEGQEASERYHPTAGNFAKGWLDHGVSPDGARYHFAMLMEASREKMAAFTQAMSDPQTAPYRIIKQDDAAHILHDRKHNTFGFVIFEPLESAPFANSPIRAVNKPCFVMTHLTADGLDLSISDPAHQQIDWATPTTIRLTLTGAWHLPEGMFSPQPIVERARETLSSASAAVANNATTLIINGEANSVYGFSLVPGETEKE